MARFGGRSKGSEDKEERGGRGEGRSSSRGEGRSSSRSSGGGRSSGRSSGGGRRGGGDNLFTRLGGVTCSRKHEEMAGDLRRDDIGLVWKVYLPEGTDQLKLKNGDRVFIQIGKVHEKAPSYVVGSVSLPPEGGSED